MKPNEMALLLKIPKLPTYIARVEQQMRDRLEAAYPAIGKPALRIVNGSGKRLRPMLVIAAAISQGARVDKDVIRAATALELAHLASLVHDDMLDHADLRGGVATIHGKEGIDSAILVGDYLLAAASHEAASVSQAVGSVVSKAITDMCEGQMRETADTYNVQRTVESYRATIQNKTAALLGAACEVGGLCAQAPAASCTALRKYGQAFGVSYQLIDDLLDFVATTEAMGKPVHNDVKEGVYTLPLLLSLAGPSRAFVRPWLGKKPERPATHATVIDRLLRDGSFTDTIAEIKLQNKQAARALRGLSKSAAIEGFLQLPDHYLQSALHKQTVLPRHV
jgi:geranylgeranyl pyrophosphate synthase